MAATSSSPNNLFMRLLLKQLSCKPIPKSPKLVEQEKNLFLYWRGIPFNRWLLFPAAFMVQFCCGSLYAWSNFNKPIDQLIYNSSTVNRAPNTFYIAIGMLGVAAFTLGPWVERHGPRRALLLGSTIFGVGNAITAISLHQKSIIGVYIGYGVLAGFGIGLNYISPVSALQKYFPDYRGVASGFAVGGFGAGSSVWSKTYLPLLVRFELPWTFGILAIVQTGVMMMAAMIMRTPPADFTVGGLTVRGDTVVDDEGFKKQVQVMEDDVEKNAPPEGVKPGSNVQIGLIESIRSADFGFMYLMLFANQLFGLVVFSRLSNMVQDLFLKSRDEGSTVVSVNGVFNFMGRLSHPLIGDFVIRKFKINPPLVRKVTFMFTLITQISILGGLRHVIGTHDYGAFRGLIWCCTMVYGGGFGTIPCFLTDMFGPYNIGALHGLILTAWSIGGVGGGLGFTHLYDKHKPRGAGPFAIGDFDAAYKSNLDWIQIVMGIGFLMACFVRTDYNDRISPGWRYSIFGRKVIHLFPNAKSNFAIQPTDKDSRQQSPNNDPENQATSEIHG